MSNKDTVKSLKEISDIERKMKMRDNLPPLPSREELKSLIGDIKSLVFPDIYGASSDAFLLIARVEATLRKYTTEDVVEAFVAGLPEIKRLLMTDVYAVAHNDPAVVSGVEVVLSYPAIHEMIYYRSAHALYELGVPMIPRMLTEIAHCDTGIDIHPAARIGEYFAIDHGTGVVVGETCVIGNHVMLYQGVTLGAKNFQYDESGMPLNVPRHPILEDNVTVYSNTSILGRVTIGHDTVIGGNIWLTHDVEPNSRIVQRKAVTEKD